MKTLEVFGLEQMNEAENANVNGGGKVDWAIYCCIDIPPMQLPNDKAPLGPIFREEIHI